MARTRRLTDDRPRWSTVLTALREARGVTQDGWAAWLGYSRATVQRWESGEAAPAADAEAAILRVCEEKGLFRAFEQGPLAGLNLTADGLRSLLAEARLGQRAAGADIRGPPPADRTPSPAVGAARLGQQPPRHLPALLTSFVGREQEVAEVRRLLSAGRLLTLTGTGGIGKTRLALRALEGMPGDADFRLVELASLTDPALVPRAVATVLGVREEPGCSITLALIDACASREILLLLDNCEHLVTACADLAAALLQACPAVRILATSREPLGVTGEMAWRVPPLGMADPHPPTLSLAGGRAGGHRAVSRSVAHGAQPRPAGESARADDTPPSDPGMDEACSPPPRAGEVASLPDAARLFMERATAALPSFAVTERTAPMVAQICRRLDGIPLAIELAAARVTVLTVEQIAARLDDRFRLLTGGSRAALPRQQTLRAALDWSYGLLSESERAVFRRLSVFAAGCGIEAAEEVTGDRGQGTGDRGRAGSVPTVPCSLSPVPSEDVLDILGALVDKSLVIADVQGEAARYHMLETIRQYGLERLREVGGESEIRRRHARWFRDLAVQLEPGLRGPQQRETLDRLEHEHDNLRVALGWAERDAASTATGMQLAAALRLFWFLRGHSSEGRSWIDRLLAAEGDAPVDVRALALDGGAALAHSQGDIATARALQEQSLVLWRELENPQGLAQALNTLGVVVRSEGDYERARAVFEEALDLMRQAGNASGAASVLNNLGATAIEQGDCKRAMGYHEESLALKRTLGDRAGIAVSLHNLAEVVRTEGDAARAAELLEESLALWRELGSTPRIAHSLHSLGLVADRLGNHARAEALLGESLALFRQVDDRVGVAMCIEGLATVAVSRGDHTRAARLLGAAEALREVVGAPVPPSDRHDLDRAHAAAQAGLDQVSFTAALLAGRAMPLERAIAEATP